MSVAASELGLLVVTGREWIESGGLFVVRAADGSSIIGRSPSAEIEIVAPTVSRQHATLEHRAEGWQIRDLGSRHGTYLNDLPIAPDEVGRLCPGDEIRIGPITFRVTINPDQKANVTTLGSASDKRAAVSVISSAQLGGIAQRRLDVLTQAAARIAAARDLVELAHVATTAATKGTGGPRALLLRPTSHESDFEVLGRSPADERHTQDEGLSRSIVALAIEGKVAQLVEDSVSSHAAHSINELGIRSAICVPIMIDPKVEAVLYLDARGCERQLAPDAAAFCVALAKLTGMALANLRRKDLEKQEAVLRRDLEAARRAQRQIMPPSQGTIRSITYAMVSIPGRYVAGDLFDVIEVDQHRTLVLLGDVTGKGVSAGLVMATVQAYIRGASKQSPDPRTLTVAVNRFICDRVHDDAFVTLWLGLLDTRNQRVQYVDAGHGHWLLISRNQPPRALNAARGIPVGIEPETDYQICEFGFEQGTRIVLFSDGLVEQGDKDKREFGMQRIRNILASGSSAVEDVASLQAALWEHAGDIALADDLTIASIEHK